MSEVNDRVIVINHASTHYIERLLDYKNEAGKVEYDLKYLDSYLSNNKKADK